MKNTYFTPEINLIALSCEDAIRTSHDRFVVERAFGDGDEVSVNKLLGISES